MPTQTGRRQTTTRIPSSPSFSLRKLRLQRLHDEVADPLRNFLEPVRSSCRDYHHVALRQMMRYAALDRFPARLKRVARIETRDGSAGHERGFAVHDIEDVGFLGVNLHGERTGLPVAIRARHRVLLPASERSPR